VRHRVQGRKKARAESLLLVNTLPSIRVAVLSNTTISFYATTMATLQHPRSALLRAAAAAAAAGSASAAAGVPHASATAHADGATV